MSFLVKTEENALFKSCPTANKNHCATGVCAKEWALPQLERIQVRYVKMVMEITRNRKSYNWRTEAVCTLVCQKKKFFFQFPILKMSVIVCNNKRRGTRIWHKMPRGASIDEMSTLMRYLLDLFIRNPPLLGEF